MLTREQFVKKYYPFVVNATKGTGIFPETLFAQAIMESQGRIDGEWYPGESKLAKKYNNYFGIKANSAWKGKRVNLDTGEFIDNQNVVVNDAFRVYPTVEDSIKDYIHFLSVNSRYKATLKAPDFKQQVIELQKAGYATNPNYATLLTKVGESVRQHFSGAIDAAKNNLPLIAIGVLFFFC